MTRIPLEGRTSLDLGAGTVEVVTTTTPTGVDVRATLQSPRLPDATSASLMPWLDMATLGSPGDAQVVVVSSRLTATRFLADPSTDEVHQAGWDLARSLAQLAPLAEVGAAGAVSMERIRAAPLPTPPADPQLDELMSFFVRATAPGPTYAAPDPAGTPIGAVVPGRVYFVKDRQGGWASVIDDLGRQVWLDASVLEWRD